MIAYVLDASVAAKWVLPPATEPLAVEATRLLDSFGTGEARLSVPDLFWPEIGNILWKCVRRGRISEQSALDGIDWLQALGISTSPTMPLMREAVKIALTFERSVYDSVYLALALASGRFLITADERLANALAVRLPVRWLGSV